MQRPLRDRLETVRAEIKVVSSHYARNRTFVEDSLGLSGDPALLNAEADATCKRLLAWAFFRKILVHELPATVPPQERRKLEVTLHAPFDHFHDPGVIEHSEKWADQHLLSGGEVKWGPGSTVSRLNLGPEGVADGD